MISDPFDFDSRTNSSREKTSLHCYDSTFFQFAHKFFLWLSVVTDFVHSIFSSDISEFSDLQLDFSNIKILTRRQIKSYMIKIKKRMDQFVRLHQSSPVQVEHFTKIHPITPCHYAKISQKRNAYCTK
jgi:hypothetical protein